MVFYMAFCLAIVATFLQSSLLPLLLIQLFCFLALLLLIVWIVKFKQQQWLLVVIAVLLGVVYVNAQAQHQFNTWLPITLEQQTLTLLVEVEGLPVQKNRNIQFEAKVLKAITPLPNGVELRHILLSDYEAKQIKPCERFQVEVRLKRPHGLGNPVGFDYEAYLLEQGIQARGYVVAKQPLPSSPLLCIHQWRQLWNDYVQKQVPSFAAALIIALSSGEKSLLSDEQNSVLLATGTMHLFVISGSHIALAALAVYGLILGLRRIGLGRLWPGDWRPLATFMALLVAALYCVFAGFAVPSVRALIMLTIFMSGKIIGVQSSLWCRFWLSMALVLIINPLSPLNVGFALSFGAVAVLILLAESTHNTPVTSSFFWRGFYWIKTLLVMQCWVFVGLLPLMSVYFGQVSLISPLMNFIAVPVVELVILPFLLLSLLLWCIGLNYLATPLLWLISKPLDGLFFIMNKGSNVLAQWMAISPAFYLSDSLWWLLLLIVFLLLLPAVFRLRYFSLVLCCLLCVLWLKPVSQASLLQVHVVDVDQGLSVLIETQHHTLLVDTGSSWQQGSMAERAVLPFLYSHHHFMLDTLLISHLDNDHAGGVIPLTKALVINKISSSEPIKGMPVEPCYAGQHWQWDGVDFTILHPQKNAYFKNRNNQSCVLLITAANKTFLLPGDIEAEVERALVATLPKIDVLIAPHHGSKTSSTEALVQKNAKGMVVFSSGYLSRFGHPHAEIEKRYQKASVTMFTTALSGLVTFDLQANGVLAVDPWRENHGKYWQKITRPHNHPLQ